MRFIRRTDEPGTVIYLLHRTGKFATTKGKLLAQWNGFCWVSWDESPHPETHPSFNIVTDAPELVEPDQPSEPFAESTDVQAHPVC